MKRSFILWIAVLIATAFSGAKARAAVHYYFISPNGNWADPANWNLEEVPGASTSETYAHIDNSTTATISSAVPLINRAQIGYTAASGTVNIVSGGSITTLGPTEVGRIGLANSSGYMTISGGYYRSGGTGGSQYLKVGVDSAGKAALGVLTVSGGTLESKLMIGSTGIDGATADKMRVEGNASTVFSTVSQTSGSGLVLGSSATLEFVFGSAGISCLTFANANASFSPGSRITVDGAAYGGAGTLTLIDALAFTNNTPEIILQNFGAGTSYNWNTTNGTFKITVVPKPSGLLFALNAIIPYQVKDSFIAYLKSSTNPDLFGLRTDGRFYPYSPPGGRRIAYRQPVPDKSLYLQGWLPEEAEAQLRRDLEATVSKLRPVVFQKTGRNFDALSADSQEILLDFGYSEGVDRLSEQLIRAAVALDWAVLLDPVVYSRNEADWPDIYRNKAYWTRWGSKGDSL